MFLGKIKNGVLAYGTRAKDKSECILCESKRPHVIQFIGSQEAYSIKLGWHLADTLLLLLIHRGATPVPICFCNPLPAISTPENWFPWLHLCAALHIYGRRRKKSYMKSCLLSSIYYLMFETEKLAQPPHLLPIFFFF